MLLRHEKTAQVSPELFRIRSAPGRKPAGLTNLQICMSLSGFFLLFTRFDKMDANLVAIDPS
jgi:hypothetical protein